MNEINKDKIFAECDLIAIIAGMTDGLGCFAFPVEGDMINLEHETNIPTFIINDTIELQSPCEFNGYKWSVYHLEEIEGKRASVFHKSFDNVLLAIAASITSVVALEFIKAGDELDLG